MTLLFSIAEVVGCQFVVQEGVPKVRNSVSSDFFVPFEQSVVGEDDAAASDVVAFPREVWIEGRWLDPKSSLGYEEKDLSVGGPQPFYLPIHSGKIVGGGIEIGEGLWLFSRENTLYCPYYHGQMLSNSGMLGGVEAIRGPVATDWVLSKMRTPTHHRRARVEPRRVGASPTMTDNPRPQKRTDNEPPCPSCGGPIQAVTTRGPGRHIIQPCGHRVLPQCTVDALNGGDGGLRADGSGKSVTTDQTTIQIRDDAPDPVDAPLAPVDIEDVDIDGAAVLGAVDVNNCEQDNGGVWNLSLLGGFSTHTLTAVEVADRLQEGTYALVRLDGDDDV